MSDKLTKKEYISLFDIRLNEAGDWLDAADCHAREFDWDECGKALNKLREATDIMAGITARLMPKQIKYVNGKPQEP